MITIIIALTGLTGVILFFRIERVTDILIGDGKSVIKRQKEGIADKSLNEPVIDSKYIKRLRDAIYRKNIYGIEEGIRRISRKEIESKETPNEKGYSKHALPKFLKTKRILNRLKFLLVFIILLSIVCVLIHLFNTPNLTDIKFSVCIKCIMDIGLWSFTIIFFISIVYAVLFSIYFKTPHEKEKIEECKNLLVI